MELKEFLTGALTGIIQGIKDAQSVDGVGEYIVPQNLHWDLLPENSSVKSVAASSGDHLISTLVDFDVAVTAEKSKAGGGTGGIRIAVFEAGIAGKLDTKNVQSSRIKFSVPILLPESPKVWCKEGC
ncbi:MAG: hypothetical protein ACREQI_02095 [Candidatus Binataceae bacterium]